MKKTLFLLMVSALLLGVNTEARGQDQRPVAFTHAVIIDGNGGEPIENGTLVVRGEKIEASGRTEEVSIPADAEIRNLGGKALMPGLADMHVHLAHGWDGVTTDLLGYQRYLNALLYSGVLTVLDTGNVLPFIIQMRDEIAAGRLTGPRIYCAGPLIDGADPLWPPISYSITSIDQIPSIVRRLKLDGVDILKAYTGLSDRMLRTLVQEAGKNSLPLFVDQSWRNGSIELILGDGVVAFAHAPDFPPNADTIKMMKQRNVMFITTLSVVESYSRRRLSDLAFLEFPLIKDTTPADFLAGIRAEAWRQLDEGGRASVRENSGRLKMRSNNVKTLFEAGLLMAAGTDAPYPGVFQGEGIHRELELLVEAGLRPLDAITLATRNAARVLNFKSEWGTLQPGRLANLLVINGRPDQRIQDTRNIEIVVQMGRILDRNKLKLDPKADPGFRPVSAVSSSR
jgi:imidazolonepropionase-like amidohydrolase